jgi:hypothetical protein
METDIRINFEILTLNWNLSELKNSDNNYDCIPNTSGVYQIYGTSPLYGMNTLLYIGRATNLKERAKSHFEFLPSFIAKQPNKSFVYAEVSEENNLLIIVEGTLIAMYKPSFNSQGLINAHHTLKSRAIYIQNEGYRGMLNFENTNFYFLGDNLEKFLTKDPVS